ncbi:MAG TPA: imidazolonepropionase [Pyrinomonadaceae bacterium]|mgnify:CR=1 FL=1|nr:imidazolonepropionase [Pyrinomonadaceae bacterium]
MQQADLIVHNIGKLVTCASPGGPKRGGEMRDLGIIEKAAVSIKDGQFLAFGRSSEILGAFESDEMLDAGGGVVSPGFVDPHSHIVFGGDRLDEFEKRIEGADYLEILEAGGGIISTVIATRETDVSGLFEGGMARLDRMLASGTTMVEIKTGYGLDTETELKMLHAIARLDLEHPIDIVPTLLAAHAFPPEFADDREGYVDLICGEILPKAWDWYAASHFSQKKTPIFADVFCEKNAFDLVQSERVLKTAKALWFGIKAHCDEFSNFGASRLALSLGAVSIDHLDKISEAEVELLAASETVGVTTPTVNFNLGSCEFADARRLIDRGCAVALSTDFNPGSAPCPSQALTMAIASRYQKLLPSEALNAATINAAYAIGQGHRAGSVETGKRADLVLFYTRDYREIAYEFGGDLISNVIKRGRLVH